MSHNPHQTPPTTPRIRANERLNEDTTANPLFSPISYTRSIRKNQRQLPYVQDLPVAAFHVDRANPSRSPYPESYATQFGNQGYPSAPSPSPVDPHRRDDAMQVDYDSRRACQPTLVIQGSTHFTRPNNSGSSLGGKRKMDDSPQSRVGSPRPMKYFAYSSQDTETSSTATATSSSDQLTNCRVCQLNGVITTIFKSEEYHHLQTMHPRYTSNDSDTPSIADRYMWCGPCHIKGKQTRIKKSDELAHMERKHPEYFA